MRAGPGGTRLSLQRPRPDVSRAQGEGGKALLEKPPGVGGDAGGEAEGEAGREVVVLHDRLRMVDKFIL